MGTTVRPMLSGPAGSPRAACTSRRRAPATRSCRGSCRRTRAGGSRRTTVIGQPPAGTGGVARLADERERRAAVRPVAVTTELVVAADPRRAAAIEPRAHRRHDERPAARAPAARRRARALLLDDDEADVVADRQPHRLVSSRSRASRASSRSSDSIVIRSGSTSGVGAPAERRALADDRVRVQRLHRRRERDVRELVLVAGRRSAAAGKAVSRYCSSRASGGRRGRCASRSAAAPCCETPRSGSMPVEKPVQPQAVVVAVQRPDGDVRLRGQAGDASPLGSAFSVSSTPWIALTLVTSGPGRDASARWRGGERGERVGRRGAAAG